MKKNRWSAALLPALCTVAAFAGDASPGSPPAIPAAAFFNVEDMDEPVPSPDGDALAIRVRNTAGRRMERFLAANIGPGTPPAAEAADAATTAH